MRLSFDMTKFNDFLNEQLKSPDFKKEYDALDAEFSHIQDIIDSEKMELYMTDTIKGKCGTDCSTCSFKEKSNCKGCIEMDGKLFWGECDIHKCAKSKGFEHCGMCDKLPCLELTHYIETGHNPNRLKNLKKWKEEATNP